MSRSALILAAGDGKRMNSAGSKVLCQVLGEPMLNWVTAACLESGIEQLCAVVGVDAQAVTAALPAGCRTVVQQERRGTGHAVLCAQEFLQQAGGQLLVLCGDAPFVGSGVIQASYEQHMQQGNSATLITARLPDPTGYGRVVRGPDGGLAGIVEERDADASTRLIDEINSGAYWFDVAALLSALNKLTCANSAGEYYLTDVVGILLGQGKRCGSYLSQDAQVAEGANDRQGLAHLNQLARRRKLESLRRAGVDIPFEDGIIIGRAVTIGQDTTILPGCVILGNTSIGAGCSIGPNSVITDSTIGDRCSVKSCYITQSTMEADVAIGPFSHVRPGSHIAAGCKIGNFNEIKNSNLGEGTKMAHLTYCGDADIGSGVNFGCGTVVVTYDGVGKHRTVVEDDVFIGCNTNLVAPVTVGRGAYTAAGSTITANVPPDALAIARCPQTIKEGYALRFRKKK